MVVKVWSPKMSVFVYKLEVLKLLLPVTLQLFEYFILKRDDGQTILKSVNLLPKDCFLQTGVANNIPGNRKLCHKKILYHISVKI